MRRQHGFTLVELMVVVAIIAILGALIIGISSRTYGVNSANMAEQLSQTLNFAKTRALSTRRIHRVEIHFELDPVEVRIFQAGVTGMKRTNITTSPGFIERTIIPKSVTMYAGAIGSAAAGDPLPSQSAAEFDIDFLPNGAADVAGNTNGTDSATIYLTDNSQIRQRRVLVYSATGSSYVRTSW